MVLSLEDEDQDQFDDPYNYEEGIGSDSDEDEVLGMNNNVQLIEEGTKNQRSV